MFPIGIVYDIFKSYFYTRIYIYIYIYRFNDIYVVTYVSKYVLLPFWFTLHSIFGCHIGLYMYTYICMCMYTYMYAYMCVCTSRFIYICINTYIYVTFAILSSKC